MRMRLNRQSRTLPEGIQIDITAFVEQPGSKCQKFFLIIFFDLLISLLGLYLKKMNKSKRRKSFIHKQVHHSIILMIKQMKIC